ncbi:DNA gyrase subunit B [Streptomyces sp. NPDC017520]|uniref:DNA gyrase subunit B n=1 Tax=Streptomyces sp. NPDC017520 TaxID=3364998 RepID=UPI00379247CE
MGYSAVGIEALEGREAVRKRPGMWVGSTGERGLHDVVFQVVGWSVNRVLAGRERGSVGVTLTHDGGVRVADDGPEVPFTADGGTFTADGGTFTADGGAGGSGLEALLTRMPAAERGGRHIAHVSPVPLAGLFVPNVLSSRLTAEVRHGGTRRVQEYACGVAVARPAAAGPTAERGTVIALWPDAELFETTRCSFAVLAERFRQMAFLNRGLGISLTDERPAGGARAVSFRFPDGVRDFVAALDAETGTFLSPDVIGFEHEDPRMAGTMEVALLWSGSRPERVHGFTNSRATRQGGTHVDGFRDGVAAAVTAYARERGLLAGGDAPRTDRIGDGLTAVVSVKLDHPEYLGATRELLGNTEVRGCVGEAVREHLGRWFEEQPQRAAQIVDRILSRPEGRC